MPLYLLSWHREWPAHAVRGVALVRAAHRPAAEAALREDAGATVPGPVPGDAPRATPGDGAAVLAIDEVTPIEDPGTTGVLGYAAQAPAALRGDRGEPALAEAAMRDACRVLGADDDRLADPLVGLCFEGVLARTAHAEDALRWFTASYPAALVGATPAEAIVQGRALTVLACLLRLWPG